MMNMAEVEAVIMIVDMAQRDVMKREVQERILSITSSKTLSPGPLKKIDELEAITRSISPKVFCENVSKRIILSSLRFCLSSSSSGSAGFVLVEVSVEGRRTSVWREGRERKRRVQRMRPGPKEDEGSGEGRVQEEIQSLTRGEIGVGE